MASPLRSLAYLLPQLWRVLKQGPRTVKYPFGPAELPEGFRGRVVIRAENCRGCGLCVRDCPAFALELEREGRNAYRLIYHPERCAYCGQCELSCNFGAIFLSNEFVPGEPGRDELSVVLVDKSGG
ncbi:MAG: 4Fe-4S dicluster domain-containing protein [Anaerolineae bacterium]